MKIIEKISSSLKTPFIKNTLQLSSSSVVLMFLPLLVTPILSRLYTPADYGDWGVFSSLMYIVGSFAFLSYENTIVKTNDDNEVPNLIVLCTLVLTIVVTGVFLVFKIGISFHIVFFESFPCLPLLLLVLFISSIMTMLSNVANRQKKYSVMAITNITNGVSQAVFRILLGLYPIIAYGLIVGNIIAQVLATVLLFICLRHLFNADFVGLVSWSGIKRVAQKYKKFPLFDAPARFIEFAVGNLAIILLSLFWKKDEIGCFSMVMQFVLIPITIIGSAMGNVYYREISENVNEKEGISGLTRRVGKICFILSIIPILFLALGGDYLLVLFLGNKWSGVAPMALCMSLFSLPVILSEPLLPIFRTLERQEIRFRVNAINFVASLGILLLSAILTHNLYLSLLLYSASYALLRFIMFHSEMSLANLRPLQISRWFYWICGGCYVIVIIRLLPYLL